MYKQGEKVPQNQDVPTTESTDDTVEKMSEKEVNRYIVRLIFKIKDGIGEKIQEAKAYFNKEAEIIKRNEAEILEMKEIMNQIKNSMENIINRLDHLEDGTSDNEDKIYTLENKVGFIEKMVRNQEQKFQKI